MSWTVHAISKRDVGDYVVTLASEYTDATRDFSFEVQGDDIEVVVWQDEFVEFMKHNLGSSQPLFEAILAFHRAQEVRLPRDIEGSSRAS